MRFGVLGPLAVWTSDGRPVRVPEVKVRTLLAELLIADGQPVSADRLIEDVWGEDPPGNPANTLQTKISQLRRVFEAVEPGSRRLVARRPAGYVLDLDADDLDARRFHELTRRARESHDPRARASLLADALALWRGPTLADFADEPFAQALIARFEEGRLTATEELAEVRLELGEHGLLIGELGDLVALHPLRERLRAAHLLALYRAGRQSEALASYDEARSRLRDELGLDPGPDLAALHQAILEQSPVLVPSSAPSMSTARPRTNLPSPLTDLIGRADDVAGVGTELRSNRLVTLTGSGGVGKTRLAIETATGLLDAFPDGVWLVELARLDQPSGPEATHSLSDVAELVAAVLGIHEAMSQAPMAVARPAALSDRLAEALRGEELLLVLDNCEHVVEPAAQLAELLLRVAPRLHILATSQEPLAVPGERLWTVRPLQVPVHGTGAGSAGGDHGAAVQLFVARATAAMPGFRLDAGNISAIETICRRLDGIPLALEIAATRVRSLGVHELAERLDDRFRLLTTGGRTAPARQRTLQAMIDWSWELLTDAERSVLRRLAVHADSCSLAAAEVICAGDGVAASDVLDLLARLVDRSLIAVTHGPDGARYRLLETVTAYGLERLRELDELDAVETRHYHYYLDVAERAEPHLRGHEQRSRLERLDSESANLRSALDGAVRHDDARAALRLANALAWYWFLRGRLSEGRRSLTKALSVGGDDDAGLRAEATAWRAGITLLEGDADALSDLGDGTALDDVADPFRRARLRWFLGFARAGLGDPTADDELMSGLVAEFRAVGDRWGMAAALSSRTVPAVFRSDLATVARDGEHSLTLFRELGDSWGQLQAIEALSSLSEITGDHERAARMNRDGLRLAEELRLWTEVSFRLSRLGRAALLAGDFERAEEFHQRAARLAREQSNEPAAEFAELGLALVARRRGELDVAEAHLNRWLGWNRRLGGEVAVAMILAELGFVAELRGDADTARVRHRDGLSVARATGDPRAVAFALEGSAGAEALAGRHDLAARLLGMAGAARESVGAPLPAAERGDVDRIEAAARAGLGDRAFSAEFGLGALGDGWRGAEPWAEP